MAADGVTDPKAALSAAPRTDSPAAAHASADAASSRGIGGSVPTGSVRAGSVRTGSVRTGSVRSGSELRRRAGADAPGPESAQTRVSHYLRALGVSDDAQVRALATTISTQAEGSLDVAIDLARGRVEALVAVVGAGQPVDPLFLRRLLLERPQLLEDPAGAREVALELGDPTSGRIRGGRKLALAALEVPRRRALLFTLAVAFVLVVCALYAAGGAAHVVLAALAAVTVALWAHAVPSVFVAFAGFGRRRRRPSAPAAMPTGSTPLPPTVLVIPIYHESPARVLGAAMAMREQLLRTEGGDAFEIFVLSDSRDAAKAAAEERALRRLALPSDARIPIHYRRRARNDHTKTGNIAEFLERWGERFEVVVVLDADSVVRGETLVTLAARIAHDPRAGLVQAPILPRGGTTLFARWQQLSSWLVGSMATSGLAAWSGDHGNYFGHNAAIRVRAFVESAGLPDLPGKPPLGGPILSHDFVEAALLARAGWSVRNADDLPGSYEELPPTLGAFIARDRRWCQGNLQHLHVARARGLTMASRMHLVLGALGYLAAPMWAVFLALAVATRLLVGDALPTSTLGVVLGITLALQAIPRVLGVLDVLLDRGRRASFGGALGVVISALFEVTLGALVAPILMVQHTRIVVDILRGRTSGWAAQARGVEGGAGAAEARAHAALAVLGLALFGALLALVLRGVVGVDLLAWLAPIWLPLSLAPALAAALASEELGGLAGKAGIFLVPPETRGDALLDRAEDLSAQLAGDAAGRFRDLVLDPALVSAHLARLDAAASARAPEEIIERAARGGPTAISDEERAQLVADPLAMRALHLEAWRHWPVDVWRGEGGWTREPR